MALIRIANERELPIISALANEIWPLVYSDMISAQQIKYMLGWRYNCASLKADFAAGQKFLIASVDNKDIGFAGYNITNDPQVFYLNKLYVHPQAQGKQIGKKLLDFIAGDMKTNQASILELNVNKYNKSVAFYERMGFSTVRSEVLDIGEGYVMDDFVMRKNY